MYEHHIKDFFFLSHGVSKLNPDNAFNYSWPCLTRYQSRIVVKVQWCYKCNEKYICWSRDQRKGVKPTNWDPTLCLTTWPYPCRISDWTRPPIFFGPTFDPQSSFIVGKIYNIRRVFYKNITISCVVSFMIGYSVYYDWLWWILQGAYFKNS